MTEEPKAPNLPESNGESTPDDLSMSRLSHEESLDSPLSENMHRVTGDLDDSREVPEKDQPDSTEDATPPASNPASKRTESLMRRITGSIRRETGPLSQTGDLNALPPDLPAQDVDEAFGIHKPVQEIAPPAQEEPVSQPEPAPDLPRARETNTLLQRITGGLKRVTGSLGRTGPIRQQGPEGGEAKPSEGAAAEPPSESGELTEKRRRTTGPLGSVLAGILRGTPGEKEPPERIEADDYVAEIRQDLASEVASQPKKSRGSGLLNMITGGLKRMTGSLGHTAEIQPPPVEEPGSAVQPIEAVPEGEPPRSDFDMEVEEVLLEDRLAGTAPSESPAWAEPEDFVIELGPAETDTYAPEESAEVETPPEPQELTGEEPISLLDSGAISALEKAEEEAYLEEAGSDWMAEIRQEAVEEESEKEVGEAAGERKGVTSPLREFIEGILHPEEKQADTETEFTDDQVTGRLGLGPEAPPFEEQAAPEESLQEMEATEEEEITFDDSSFLERFEKTAEEEAPAAGDEVPPEKGVDLSEFEPYEPLKKQDTGEVFTITPEDEKLLWGAAEEKEAEKPQVSDEEYAAAFLTGADLPPVEGKTQPLRRRGTGNLKRETTRKPFEDIRSMLLDDYQAAEQQHKGKIAEPAQEAHVAEATQPTWLEEEASAVKPANFKEWLGTRTTLQKIILVEMALVLLALFIALPIFFYLLMRTSQAGVNSRTLPANLPYPTGVTLPGGWHFDLARGAMKNGQWKPAQSEWLDGTELRRVVAVPWNRQSEAVARSFQAGDKVVLGLSNAAEITYKVEEVRQVAVNDASIYSDVTPSLVIILYADDQDETQRWVVFCKK